MTPAPATSSPPRPGFRVPLEVYEVWREKNSYYQEILKRFFRQHTQPESAVVEFGAGTGDLIASLAGRRKLGLEVDVSMFTRARSKHPEIEVQLHDCETRLEPRGEPFDVVILADLIDHISDIPGLFESANASLKMGGRVCLSTVNPLWEPLLVLAEKLGLKMPEGKHNFVPNRDLIPLLRLRGFRVVAAGAEYLLPWRIPWISDWINAAAPQLPLIRRFCAIQTLVAEKIREYAANAATAATCSVVIPCHNEEENIRECLARVPSMGAATEIIVIDDGSSDRTSELVRSVQAQDSRVKLIEYQPNRGKGHAVKSGFDAAQGDVLMILDADMTVVPEELPLFFRPIAEGAADFVNGSRMIYPMEEQAMRFLNLIGNFIFGLVLSWLMGQRISDTLCGTKAFKRADYSKIPMGGDRWGDFDLLFGAAENKLHLVEIPVHYRARTGGTSKMQPFKHCVVLLKMCVRGFLRLKLRPWLRMGITKRRAVSDG